MAGIERFIAQSVVDLGLNEIAEAFLGGAVNRDDAERLVARSIYQAGHAAKDINGEVELRLDIEFE